MRKIAVVTLAVIFIVPLALAKAVDKPNPTGTWKWKVKRGD
jgi:hypothetical protein